jgi:hypothetical protein
VYLPFAVLTMFGPLPIMLLQHDPIHAKPAGLAFVAILLAALARRSVISWTLLLLWNVFLVFAAAPALGSPGMTVGAPLLSLLGLSCAAMQLTPSMRDHVGLASRQTPGQHPATPL